MNFDLSDDQGAFAEAAQQFSNLQLLPMAAEWDQNSIFPKDVLKAAGDMAL